jgi:hypothetical protein
MAYTLPSHDAYLSTPTMHTYLTSQSLLHFKDLVRDSVYTGEIATQSAIIIEQLGCYYAYVKPL